MRHLSPVVDQLRGRRVLVIGDLMLDEYLRGDVSRISPEAPVPVLEVRTTELRLGGAANTANNIQALGGSASVIGVVGVDATAETMRERLTELGITPRLVADPDRPTSKKTRLVAQQQQIVRVDQEKRSPVSGALADKLCEQISEGLRDAQACVVSDYAKGVVTAEIAQYAIREARTANVPIVVDPKVRDLSIYRGATVITPNLHELEVAAPRANVFVIEEAARALLATLEGSALLVTRSADGMTLFRTDREPVHVPAFAREVFDVTGAGDTVVATLALSLASGIPIEIAIELASVAASVSVSKRGTSTVSPGELLSEIAHHS